MPSVPYPPGTYTTPVCDPTNEPLPSTVDNFVKKFFGEVTKACVNGEVVWTLPCDLDTGIAGYPRVEGEGLACYFKRLLADILAGGAPSSTALLKENNLSDLPNKATARTNLGATSLGSNLLTLANPSAIRFVRINADNTVSTLSDADFRTAIGVGAGSGSVTSVDLSGGTTGLTASGGPITGAGTLTLGGTLVVANGGTGATDAAVARTNLGVGAADSPTFAGVTVSQSAGGRVKFVDSDAAANQRTTLFRMSDTNFLALRSNDAGDSFITVFTIDKDGKITLPNAAITGGSVSGITDLAVADGGTGASTASDARTNLGLGSLATQNSNSVSITGGAVSGITDLAVADGGTGASTASDARTNLGLGSLATQNSNSVSITGGAVSGITDLAVADGGTGASTASAARTNLGATTVGSNLFTLSNPSAVRFLRLNADNSVSSLSASDFRTAIGAGTGSGSVTSVGGTGTVNGLTLSGTVTSSGNLTLGGTLSGVNLASAVTGVLPMANGGVPTGGAKYARLTKASTSNNDLVWKGPDVTNVKDYGATGDGVVDDTTAIAAAIAALPSSNGTLYFPAGVYRSSGFSITGKTNLSIIGDGWASSVIKNNDFFLPGSDTWNPTPGNPTNGGRVMRVAASCSYVTIRGLTFDGNCYYRKTGQHGILLNSSHTTFVENRVVNAGQFSIAVGRDESTSISDVTVSNNVINNGYADGINFHGVAGGVIANNVVDGVDDDCVAVATGSTKINVVGNVLRSRTDTGYTWGRGIAVLGPVSDILVTGNIVENVKQTGILVTQDGEAGPPTFITISNNHVRNCSINSGSYVLLSQVEDVVMENNVVIGNAGRSLVELRQFDRVTISGGELIDTGTAGYARGINTPDVSGLGTVDWSYLTIKNVSIKMIGTYSNAFVGQPIYLDAGGAGSTITFSGLIISGVLSQQTRTAEASIFVNKLNGASKIGNNVSVTGSAVTFGGTGTAPTLFNNN